MGKLSEVQKNEVKTRIKKEIPSYDENVIDVMIEYIDENVEKECDEQNITGSPNEKIINDIYLIKSTKMTNLLSAKL